MNASGTKPVRQFLSAGLSLLRGVTGDDAYEKYVAHMAAHRSRRDADFRRRPSSGRRWNRSGAASTAAAERPAVPGVGIARGASRQLQPALASEQLSQLAGQGARVSAAVWDLDADRTADAAAAARSA